MQGPVLPVLRELRRVLPGLRRVLLPGLLPGLPVQVRAPPS